MMWYYFDFQREAKQILLWSKVNSYRFSASFGSGWLFTNKVLNLKSTTAIDLLASGIVWNSRSFVSNSITTSILFSLTTASVIQSNTEGLAILFQDRPIVRDYKEMLDIETELFNVAYFRSKDINLNLPFESDLLDNFDALIKKYQWLWLFETWTDLRKSETMSEIITELVEMNARMKEFILIGGNFWKNELRNYNWCMWNFVKCDAKYWSNTCCNRDIAILKFSDNAINQLYEDYKDVRSFGKCNSYAKFFKNRINKSIDNNKESVESSIDDINNSIKRLEWALIWTYNTVKNATDKTKHNTNRCDMSDYEMAQLQWYWGWNRSCNEKLFNVNTSIGLQKAKDYTKEKWAQNEQKEKQKNTIDKSANPDPKNYIIWDVVTKLNANSSTSQKENLRYKIYWKSEYNTDFSNELHFNFSEIFGETMEQYSQTQENAIASDISDLLPKWKWILDQLDSTIKQANELEKNLKKIEDKQCSG